MAISFPAGLYARIAPRSGLALKRFIDVGASIVDADYHGEVGVVLFNHGDQDFEVKMGDRIAQLILEKIDTLPMKGLQGLEDTIRGSGAFGSIRVNEKKILVRKMEVMSKMNELVKRTKRLIMRL